MKVSRSIQASLVAQLARNSPAMQETWVQSLGSIPGLRRCPWERERLPSPVFWPVEFHGLYSPCGCKQSEMTEQLSLPKSIHISANGTVLFLLKMWNTSWICMSFSIELLPTVYSCPLLCLLLLRLSFQSRWAFHYIQTQRNRNFSALLALFWERSPSPLTLKPLGTVYMCVLLSLTGYCSFLGHKPRCEVEIQNS